MTRILRVFPRRTKATPTDALARVGYPPTPACRIDADEVHISVTFTWDKPLAEDMANFALRSYLPQGHELKAKEIGSEPTPDAFIATMVAVFREVRRVLRDDGVCFINLGDSYGSTYRISLSHAWEKACLLHPVRIRK